MVSNLFGRDVCDHANQPKKNNKEHHDPDLDSVLERNSSYSLFNELMDKSIAKNEGEGFTP